MYSNTTSEHAPISVVELAAYIAWIIQGLVIGGSNLLLAVSVLKYSALRMCKEYCLLMGLALADSLNLIAFLCAGLNRTVLSLIGGKLEQLSGRECLLHPDFVLWTFAHPLASTMLSVVAIDRLFFMLRPLKYIVMGPTYAKSLLGISYVICVSYGCIGLGLAYRWQCKSLDSFCRVAAFFARPENVGVVYAWLFRNFPICSALLSVILMFATWPVYKWRQLKRVKLNRTDLKVQLKRQKEFTKSIALSSACTLVLFVVPFYLSYFAFANGYVSFSMCMTVLANCNPAMNLYIYQLRHKESQMGVQGLIKGKAMPDNIELWNPPSKTAARKRNKVAALSEEEDSV